MHSVFVNRPTSTSTKLRQTNKSPLVSHIIIFPLGQGLGKSQDGMSVPLKANLKFDQAGLGHSKSDELNNHWWERVYNSAAQNVDVNKNHDNEVSMTLKDGKSIEVHKINCCVTKQYHLLFVFNLR